jgi:dTDP-4-amino-4,6-dideoxygalactose transaminase
LPAIRLASFARFRKNARASRTTIPQVDLTRQYAAIKSEIDAAIQQTLNHGAFASSESVVAFEEEFARHCGVSYCVCVNSGTSALHLAMIAAGVRPGDEVITVPFTFVATAWAVSYVGARPVFVDIEPRSCNLDVEKLAAAIGPKTRAILPVHLYGQMADLDPIRELCDKKGLLLVEDAAQAHGAEYRGIRAGALGDMGCFSFYPTKNLGAYGEGGAVTTNNDKLAARIRYLRDHAQTTKYRHEELGYNYRMDEMQGAILRVKLRYLDRWNASRRQKAAYYLQNLPNKSLELPFEFAERRHVWHQFVVRSQERDRLRDELSKAQIGTGLHYPIPLHLQPVYSHLGYKAGDFPVAEVIAKKCLSLPMFSELEQAEMDRVCEVITRHT